MDEQKSKERFSKMTNQEVLDGFNRFECDLLKMAGQRYREIYMKCNSLRRFWNECNNRGIAVLLNSNQVDSIPSNCGVKAGRFYSNNRSMVELPRNSKKENK